MIPSDKLRLVSATQIDALVGVHLLNEAAEVFWEHSHGLFQFETETEAWRALSDSYYQLFLPEVNWMGTVVREVQQFPPYCSGSKAIWKVVAKASLDYGPLRMRQEAGRWWVSFGSGTEVDGRTPAVAICLAALHAGGLTVEVDHDRLDAELARLSFAKADEDKESGSDSSTTGPPA